MERKNILFCDHIIQDDNYYSHNNSLGMGLYVDSLDDQGLSVSLRVDHDFYCKMFKAKED